jgi:ferredoxin
MSTSSLHKLLKPYGLLLLGSLRVSPEDQVPDVAENCPAGQLLMIGNGGSSLWPAFGQSPEYRDGKADPLDRWSRRVADELARVLAGRAIFPFDGPPYPPFLSWAQKAGQVAPSRISMFIHAQFGLWHAYRFALALAEPLESLPQVSEFISPCLDCEKKPCLEACPVQAFTGKTYRVDQCMEYLATDTESACRQSGCEARRACPFAREFTYQAAHARFHMDAFVRSRHL